MGEGAPRCSGSDARGRGKHIPSQEKHLRGAAQRSLSSASSQSSFSVSSLCSCVCCVRLLVHGSISQESDLRRSAFSCTLSRQHFSLVSWVVAHKNRGMPMTQSEFDKQCITAIAGRGADKFHMEWEAEAAIRELKRKKQLEAVCGEPTRAEIFRVVQNY